MPPETLDRKYLRLGKVAALGVFVLGILYAAVTTLGLLSLKTPLSPIDDPFFTIIEVLTLSVHNDLHHFFRPFCYTCF